MWVKKSPQFFLPQVFLTFFSNGWEFLVQILRAYYTFLYTLDYKFLFNYLQLWRSYAIVKRNHHHYAQNVHHRPKCTLASHFLTFFPNSLEFLVHILHAYYRFLSTLDYKCLFNYLQLWQSYAILSATTQRAFRPMVDILSIMMVVALNNGITSPKLQVIE